MKTAAILYGWAEGPWESKQFRSELKLHNIEITQQLDSADVIVAHSSGCYLIPKNITSKKIILIGLPYWPQRNRFKSVVLKLKGEINYHRRNKGLGWWLNKILHNFWYIISRSSASYAAFTKLKLTNLPDGKKNTILLIRPDADTFCHPQIKTLLPAHNTYRIIEIPGAHDDCWVNPKPYIDLLLKEL